MNEHWQQVLLDVWGVEAQLSALAGEYDLNFLARGERDYVLKVMRPGCRTEFVELQCLAFAHLRANAPDVPTPTILPTLQGEMFTSKNDDGGEPRTVWLIELLPGKTYAEFRPHSLDLTRELGTKLGSMDKALQSFQHPELQRSFKWNLCSGDWIADELSVITDVDKRALIDQIVEEFRRIKPVLATLPSAAIHNDINDYNIIVQGCLTGGVRISGLIDLGDMCANPRICELAIAAAYVLLDHPAPLSALAELVAGYHQSFSLTTLELDLVWPLLRLRLAVSVVNSALMSAQKPDDPYVLVSQQPAWRFLQDKTITSELVAPRLRIACGFPLVDSAPAVCNWLDAQCGKFAPIMGTDISAAAMIPLGVDQSLIPENPFDMTADEALHLREACDEISIGYYAEPRLLYSDDAFRLGPYKASKRRTVHLGIDVFAPAGTPIHAPCPAVVRYVGSRPDNLDYGGFVVLAHTAATGESFFSFYGHLNPQSSESLAAGQPLEQGEVFAALGEAAHNGGWQPHLHLQLALTLAGLEDDWPGVADPDDLEFWSAICPNPATLLNLGKAKTTYPVLDKQELLRRRQAHFANNLTLSYAQPLLLVRGWQHYLFDEWGRCYLDAYNNVPHVGHAHPRIQQLAADQLRRLNSNTRYLHPAQIALAEKIQSKLPASMNTCFLVNSGSEANELALRLARAHSGGKDMITPDHGYHGNTTGAIDISAYKFNAPGGSGQAEWVQLVDVAEDYRGSYRRSDPERAAKYARQVDAAILAIKARGGKLAGFIAETFPSVGGQIIPPPGYLAAVYQSIRAAGGVCIADEVQTGLGRLGHYYFAFEQQAVVPDIVVLGKPIANGHPVGVVITTRQIADSFAQGPEYFSTFGGSTLSCLMALEVLDIVDDELLMQNAAAMGDRLLDGLRELQARHLVIGDVRGYGLFIGVDLVLDRNTREPATAVATYVKNRLREQGILVGCEGPADNILKIRPPLTIQANDVEMILAVLDGVLTEVHCALS